MGQTHGSPTADALRTRESLHAANALRKNTTPFQILQGLITSARMTFPDRPTFLGGKVDNMKRRDFFKSALVTGGVLGRGPRIVCRPSNSAAANRASRRVLIMFKCHFDLGFIDTQVAIIHRYFEKHYPEALRIASTMRQVSDDRYVWTTGSWLLYEYLEQATSEQRKVMEQAVSRGDIAWHALPYTWQTEFLTVP